MFEEPDAENYFRPSPPTPPHMKQITPAQIEQRTKASAAGVAARRRAQLRRLEEQIEQIKAKLEANAQASK